MESWPGQRRAQLALGGLLVVYTLLFFRGVVAGESFFALDFHLTFEPLRTILGHELGHGIPRWNGWLSNGVPLLANPMNGAAYSPNLLFLVLPAPGGLTWLTLAHVLFGAAGALRLARRWGLSGAAAWTTAVVFGFNGAAVSATAFVNLCWTWSWMPWLLLTRDRVANSSGGRRVLGLASLGLVTAAMLVLGDPFVILGAFLGLGLLSLGEVLSSSKPERGATALRGLGLPAFGAVAGVLLAWPVLAGYLSYVPHTLRGMGFKWEGVTQWSLHPLLLVEALLPGAYGDGVVTGFHHLGGFWARTLTPEKGHPLLAGLYVGAPVLAIVLVGLLSRKRRTLTLLAWCVLLVLLALGRHGPLYGVLYALPGFDALRYPVKWLLPAMLPLALLAGFGVQGLGRMNDAGRGRRTALLAGLGVAALLGLLSVAATPGLDGWMVRLTGVASAPPGLEVLVRSAFLGALLRSASALAVLLLLLAVSLRRPAVPLLAFGVAALVSADLLLANARYAPTVPASFYTETPPVVSAIHGDEGAFGRVFVEDSRDNPPRLLANPRSFAERGRWQRESLVGYTGAAYGLRLAFNKDTEELTPVRYVRLRVLVESAPDRERLMLLGMSGVTHIVTHRTIDSPSVEPVTTIAGRTDPPLRVYRNRLALPRVRLVGTLETYDGDEGFIDAVARGQEQSFAERVLVEAADLPPAAAVDRASDATARSPSTRKAELLADRGSVLEVRTRGGGGYLVVSDNHLPGWRATVDGRATPVFRADYAFIGLAVPPGEHRIVLTYRP